MASVYIHIVKSNGKKYVGQCSGNPQDRWGYKGHRYKGQRFYRAIAEHGWDNMTHNIIATDLTQEEADRLEKFYIERYKTDDEDHGYNKTIGGKDGAGSPGASNPNAKSVVCVETGEWFECASFCAKHLGVHSSSLQESLYNGYAVKGKHYRYSDDVNYKINERRHNYGVECIETGDKWTSLTEASSVLNVCVESIKRYCTGKRTPSNGMHYKYYIV